MDYPFLNINLRALAGQKAVIHAWIMQAARAGTIPRKIMTNAAGWLDWECRPGQGLFQGLAPQKAYQDWQGEAGRPQDASLVVGANVGYGLHALLERSPETHRIMVLEPRLEMLLATIGLTDFRLAIEQRRLTFIPPHRAVLRDLLYQLTLPCLFGKVILRSDLPSRQLGPEYELWTRHCRQAMEDMRVELYTLRHRQDRMVQNELSNLSRAGRQADLSVLQGRAAGLRAVVLGAGPSLEDYAPRLAAKTGQVLLLTSLQAMPALHAYGLKPHFCMALECDPCLAQVYQNLDPEWARDIPLVYAITTAPEVVKAYPGPTMPLWTLGGLSANLSGDQGSVLETGGNVAVMMVRFLAWCSVDQVLLIGHDFAWQGVRTHAAHHRAADNRFAFKSQQHLRFKNREGQVIYSDPSYMTALRQLEQYLEQVNLPVWNLYGGGMEIRGARSVSWEEIMEQGYLQASQADPGAFAARLQGGSNAFFNRSFDLKPHFSRWIKQLRLMKSRIVYRPSSETHDRQKALSMTHRLLSGLDQEPLLKPYLINEMLNLSGVFYAKNKFGREECRQCRQILNQMTGKVMQIDKALAPLPVLH